MTSKLLEQQNIAPMWKKLIKLLGKSIELRMFSSFIEKQKLILSVYVDDIEVAGKNQNKGPHVEEVDEKNVDFDEPTSFLDHVYLGCTQRECKPNKIVIEQYKEMLASRIFCWSN